MKTSFNNKISAAWGFVLIAMSLTVQADAYGPRNRIGNPAYNTAPSIRASVHAMRIERVGKQLRVTEILELLNASAPPQTIQKEKLFWLALPEGASMPSSAAQTPEGLVRRSIANFAPGEGRCYFSLPLQAGTTKVQLQYQLPFSERVTFAPHIPFPADSFGVVMTPDLQFTAAEPGSYMTDSDQHGEAAQVVHDLQAGNAGKFTISLSRTMAGGSEGPRDPGFGQGLTQLVCITLPGFALILGFALYRNRRQRSYQQDSNKPMAMSNDSIPEELFALELARVQNWISKRRYAALKAALENRMAVSVSETKEPA